MIARHETHLDKVDIWSALSAPLPPGVISWRQDGRPVTRDGRHIARFVAYIEANTVRERLDAVVPGEWDLTLELLPTVTGLDEDANQGACSFKARLQILGVIREDVGTGKDYKQAATDAFKRAAVRFGIAHELYAYEQNWVQMDGDGKYAKPVEDPAVVYARRYGRPKSASPSETNGASSPSGGVAERSTEYSPTEAAATVAADVATGPLASDEQSCPTCGGRMWDNRLTKRNPKAPDYKCRDRSCDGVLWPPKLAKQDAPKDDLEETEQIPF
ncbi:MAG: Rad52/22 double-strand break repair protein [Gemmatimonadetes bacterium]|nr:Rad52/22 double-strand break repair protein [Gemmatimonadota bacterium]